MADPIPPVPPVVLVDGTVVEQPNLAGQLLDDRIHFTP